uniref:Uncharacterized protein n=1 Tax=viral metagenome TaxID=1070528 RepID=A0A6C0C221_9ZZZZ
MERSERLTQAAAVLVLFAAAILNASVATAAPQSKPHDTTEAIKNKAPASTERPAQHANSISVTICLVAALAYLELHVSCTGLMSGDVRSLDWLITCPLLLIEMGLLLGARATDGVVLLAAGSSALMVITGWDAHTSSASFCYGVFFFAITALCMYNLWRRSRSTRTREGAVRLAAAAFALWPLYGIVAASVLLCGSSQAMANIGYNVLDIGSKGFLGLSIALLVLSEQ